LIRRGFTLLEVMVAVAILGMSLTVILSAQAGLYSGSAYAQHSSIATGLARCRMSEIEEKLLKIGFSITDVNDEGVCCEDDSRADMTCTWRIDRVKLPSPPGMGASPSSSSSSLSPGASAGLDSLLSLSKSGGAALQSAGPLGMLSQLAQNPQSTSLSLSLDGGAPASMSTLAQGLSQGPAGGASGMAALAMVFVYPQLKPMLEASIRKVTVSVKWKEGIRDQDLTIVQYITHPMKAGLLASPTGTAAGAPASTVGSPMTTGGTTSTGATK
jgi:general secretion pathway protein I